MTVLALLQMLVLVGLMSIGAYVFFLFGRNYIRAFTSPISILPGPRRTTFLHGSFPNAPEPESLRLIESWIKQFGPAIRIYSIFGIQKLLTVDTKAVQHILGQGYLYQKSDQLRHVLGSALGEGLLFVEGEAHKRQRKVINPAFGPVQVRKFTETFVRKAQEVRDIWISLTNTSVRKDGWTPVDAYSWLNRATLDIIGLTGFGYDFDALHSDENHPNELFDAIHGSVPRATFSTFLQLLIPAFRSLPTPYVRNQQQSLKVIRRIGFQLIQERKASVMVDPDGVVEKEDIGGHDLLSQLIKANMASDMPPSMQLNDEEILAQVPTFLVAGHETTSTLVAWTLFALATALDVQQRLREELRVHMNDTPTLDELESFPYLDKVLRETLRLHAPVVVTQRVATQDDFIPLDHPIQDKYGRVLTEIRVTKGDVISIPIEILNRSEDIWGDDATIFRPERWDNLPETTKTMPGIYSHVLSFLAGPHACIGFRFSIAEAKALLFVLVRNFEFRLAVSPVDIIRRIEVVGRPFVWGNPYTRPQLPLLIRPATA